MAAGDVDGGGAFRIGWLAGWRRGGGYVPSCCWSRAAAAAAACLDCVLENQIYVFAFEGANVKRFSLLMAIKNGNRQLLRGAITLNTLLSPPPRHAMSLVFLFFFYTTASQSQSPAQQLNNNNPPRSRTGPPPRFSDSHKYASDALIIIVISTY